jgi:hypothetical protein
MKAFYAVSLCLLCACSNQAIYDGIQENRRNKCRELPQGQYEKCMAQYEQPYDDYARERREMLDQKNQKSDLSKP